VNAAIWQAINVLARKAPEWHRTCGHLYRGFPTGRKPAPHALWYEIPGEDLDAFDSDIGTMLGQFTLVSGQQKDDKIDAMIRATQTLFNTARLTTATMLVGHMQVSHTARISFEDGYVAQLDCEITFQGTRQVPVFAGRG
jgi:hypothetical protein